jgi:hypothetical protein
VTEPDYLLEALVALAQLVPALLLVALAGRLPPNPLVGVRLGYTLSSPRVWRRANRLAGTLLALASIASLAVGLEWGLGAEASALVVGDVLGIVAVVEYSRRLLERVQVSEEAPEEPPAGLAAERGLPAVASGLLVAAAALLVYEASRAAASLGLPSLSTILIGLLAVDAYLAYLAIARPEAYSRPWLTPREASLAASGVVAVATLATMAVSLAVTGSWKPFLATLSASLVVLAVLTAYMIRKYLKWAESTNEN